MTKQETAREKGKALVGFALFLVLFAIPGIAILQSEKLPSEPSS